MNSVLMSSLPTEVGASVLEAHASGWILASRPLPVLLACMMLAHEQIWENSKKSHETLEGGWV